MQGTWQTGVANATLQFSGEARFQIFTQKWLLGNIKYFVSFKLKSLEWNGLSQKITLSKHWPPTGKLFGSLDWYFTIETSDIGKNEKSPLHSLFQFYPKIKSITGNISNLSTKLQVCSGLDYYSGVSKIVYVWTVLSKYFPYQDRYSRN